MAPREMAMARFTGPATPSLTTASQLASVSVIFRVRLSSMPRRRHGPRDVSDGAVSLHSAGSQRRNPHLTISPRASETDQEGGPRRARTDDPRIKSPMLSMHAACVYSLFLPTSL